MASRALTFLSALTASALLALPAAAQDDASGQLTIELNAVEPQESACKMSFVIMNGFETDLTSVVFETVLFDASGAVDRLTLFDFGALPAMRTRVRQFVVPQMACDNLGRVLFNGAQTCAAETEGDYCTKGLRLESRIGVEVIG